MNIYNQRAEQGGRMMKEWDYRSYDEARREPICGGYEVLIKGAPRPIYFCNGFEFRTKREMLEFSIAHLRTRLRESTVYSIEERFSRKRTRAEKSADIERMIDSIRQTYPPLFSSVLSKPGPWNEILEDSPASMKVHEEKAGEDLRERLVKGAGGEFELLVLSLLFPQILKDAVGALPEGETVADIEKERKESAERGKAQLAAQIREAEELLKKLPRDE